MKIRFVGTGSAFSGNVNNSAYFVNDDKLFLIDCGETVFATLKRSKILDNVKDVYVFITHTHSDHIGSLSSLVFYNNIVYNRKVHLVSSDNYQIKDDIISLLKINGNNREQYDFVDKNAVKDIFGLKDFEIYSVKHVPNLKSYGLKFVDNDSRGNDASYYYTGDSCDEDFIKMAIQDKSLKCLYVDVALNGGGAHLNLETAYKLLYPYKEKVKFMHLESPFIYNRIKGKGMQSAETSAEMMGREF